MTKPLEKVIGMALLADFYGALLTEKQRQALDLFYGEDYSLAEIAQSCACSRQAAHDLIKRSEALLIDYERKLNLVAHYQERKSLLQQAKEELNRLDIPQEATLWQIWRQLEINNGFSG